MSGLLKRKFEEVEGDPCYSSSSPSSTSNSSSSSSSAASCSSSSSWDSDDDNCCGETWATRRTAAFPSTPFTPVPILKRAKRTRKNHVQFDRVVVFYFARCQGFTSVPSQGGCTLGMASKHSSCQQYTLAEFAKEQEQVRSEKIKELLKEQKLNSLRLQLTKNGTADSEEADRLTVDDISDDDIDVGEVELDSSFFPQPYPAKKRHTMLKAAGVKKIDREEKRELNAIRMSREDCGCDCKGFCEPETCSCSLAGIKCQMDRMSFPCGCTKDGCGNTMGRIEFNSARVQTHFIHTIMKLDLETRQVNSANKNEESETLLLENSQHYGYSADKNVFQDRSASVTPAFQYSEESDDSEENSCSSDMTDFTSSNYSEEADEGADDRFLDNGPQSHQTADIDDDGLARILHFNDSDNECGNDTDNRDGFPYFSPSDFFCETGDQHSGMENCKFNAEFYTNHLSTLDENANQEGSFPLGDIAPMQGNNQVYPPPHCPEQGSKSYTDLSLSTDSFEFFQSFSEFNYGSFHNPQKDYESIDNCPTLQFQFPGFPSFSQATDPGSCFLESLIGLAEPITADSFPEPPKPFPDSQHLEEAIKTSIMETVKV
ncbi:cysteine/serine-rich nuclear protein 1b isoform X1 [Pristis pectinata]|uniref:cysteine/serine-rich nuclear protein 1b isoform X1 n=1 Tax=Pristis pectinata TaxID=685728 RepID=UPI00223DD90C|nr:cysteine/serine-rich nuclear protein 1b isoform X1 [Pristis pectinata]XP_051879357.1 cysteine/serine-rich nuclear protein 1b isoform X1 [Pristis pectinata]